MRNVCATVVLVLLIGMCAGVSAQTNPCTVAPPTGVVMNPTGLLATLPEQTTLEADGLPRVTDYQLAYFDATNPTGTPLLLPVTIQKTSFVLQTGSTNCYKLAGALPTLTTPIAGALVAGLKARRAARTGVDAAESAYTISVDSFGTAPSALAAPGRVLISQ